MKRKIGMELISKELVISAGVGVIIGILVLSYAANNNLNKMQDIEDTNVLYGLAQEIISAHDSGAIDNKGVANSLASKVMAAYRALGEDDTDTAVAALEDLISHVNDQSGKHITVEEAGILIGLANDVINPAPPCNYALDPACLEAACGTTPTQQCIATVCIPNTGESCIA